MLAEAVERVLEITGRIDLVHCNDSRDSFDSGADRHANLGDGEIAADALLAVVAAAGAPVVVETPGGREGQAADIAWLRKHLALSPAVRAARFRAVAPRGRCVRSGASGQETARAHPEADVRSV